MMNQLTKFEVCIFARYEDMNGDTKCRKLGRLEYLGVIESH